MCVCRNTHLKHPAQKFIATTYLLTCYVDYISEERKQDTFNTQQNITQTGNSKRDFFLKIYFNLKNK